MSDIFIKLISIHFQLRSPICNQKDLDIAINLVDKNERSTSLRLILTSPTGQGHGQVRRTGAPSIDTGYSSIRSQVRGPEKGNLIEKKSDNIDFLLLADTHKGTDKENVCQVCIRTEYETCNIAREF